MEFKKCARCGCFFMSNNDVCCNCESKDMFDIAKLNSIMEDNINFNSIQELSNESGITIVLSLIKATHLKVSSFLN